MAEDAAGLSVEDAQDDVLRFAGRICPQSPAPSPPSISRGVDRHFRAQRHIIPMCPFSFDLRDSIRRAAHERKLEELRLESRQTVSFSFRANPVRKYKPLGVKQSSVPLTVPKWPFSREEP